MSQGLKIAVENGNAETDSDKDLAFTSDHNILKAIYEDIEDISYTASSGSATATIPHNLNFTPQVLAFIDNEANKYFGQGQDPDNNSDGNYVAIWAWADSTNIYLNVRVSSLSSLFGGNQTFSVKYFAIADTAREASTQTNFPTPYAEIGLKIAKPNKSADSNFIEDFIVHPQMPSLKLNAKGSTSITGGGTTSIAHGLSFAPAFLLMVSLNNTDFFLAPYNPSIGGDSAYGWSTTTHLHIRSFNFPATAHYFKYLIFANKVNP